jgi:hypothetical protein
MRCTVRDARAGAWFAHAWTAQLGPARGALPVTVAAGGSSAEFMLPRCGRTSCLPEGRHQLMLRMDIAGVDAQPAASSLDFEVRCPLPEADPEAPRDPNSGSRLAARSSGAPGAMLALAALLGALLGRRRSRRAQQR